MKKYFKSNWVPQSNKLKYNTKNFTQIVSGGYNFNILVAYKLVNSTFSVETLFMSLQLQVTKLLYSKFYSLQYRYDAMNEHFNEKQDMQISITYPIVIFSNNYFRIK